MLKRAVAINANLDLPNLKRDELLLKRLHLQQQPGFIGWLVRRLMSLVRFLEARF